MALETSLTGLFSRYFLVGFFLPAYFSWLILWLTSSTPYVPHGFEKYTGATKLLALAGLALLSALAASGLNYPLLRVFEGYWLEQVKRVPVIGRPYWSLLAAEKRRRDRILEIRDNDQLDGETRGLAAWRLDRSFPSKSELLPTRFGNAVRAFEDHAFTRYGLDSISAFPRIEMMMSSAEREPLLEAKIDLNVFLNGMIGSLLVGGALVVDEIVHKPIALYWAWIYLIPFAIAYLLYRFLVGTAVRWGSQVRSAIDLHRLELYEKIGFRTPASFSDEHRVAGRVNYLLLVGSSPKDTYWRRVAEDGGGPRQSDQPSPDSTSGVSPAPAGTDHTGHDAPKDGPSPADG